MTDDPREGRPCVLVVGAGLVGTSLGLALSASGAEVHVWDADPDVAAAAVARGAGSYGRPEHPPDLVVVAVPPDVVASVVLAESRLYLESTVSDVASIKSKVLDDMEVLLRGMSESLLERRAEASGGPAHEEFAASVRRRFVPGHPLAGREVSGPLGASADLFQDRVWVLSPTEEVEPARVAAVAEVVRRCGAEVVLLAAADHDRAVALTSHTPQLVASALAARLAAAPDQEVALSGTGLRDTTRIAGSDPALWTQILAANAGPVADVLDRLVPDLDAVRRELRAAAHGRPAGEGLPRVRSVLEAGVAGRARIPGKHGAGPVRYAIVVVHVADRPGELGRLFAAVGETRVNLEDVRIEHALGRPTGLVELAVDPARSASLIEALAAAGWTVREQV